MLRKRGNIFHSLFTSYWYCVYKCLKYRYIFEVDCSLGQFKSTKLKGKECAINASSFYKTLQIKKEIDAPILTFVGRWSAVDLCC